MQLLIPKNVVLSYRFRLTQLLKYLSNSIMIVFLFHRLPRKHYVSSLLILKCVLGAGLKILIKFNNYCFIDSQGNIMYHRKIYNVERKNNIENNLAKKIIMSNIMI